MSPAKRRVAFFSSGFAWLALAVFLLAVFARLLPGARTIDDSYITFRYARNILAGNGFVYNPGERVLGTTTPLYTLLLSSIAAMTGGTEAPFPIIALIVNALADGTTCMLLLYTGRRLGSIRAGIGCALVWAIAPFSVTFAIGGLETSVFVLILVSAWASYLDRRFVLTALLAALAVLTRPDALILIGPLVLDRILEVTGWGSRLGLRSRAPAKVPRYASLREALAFLIPVVLWLFFATYYFGSPLPHSILAKSVAYRLPADAAFIRLLQHYSVPFMGNQTFGVWWIGVGMLMCPFLFLVGAIQSLKREPHSWPFLAYPWLYFAAFALANPLIFRWYLTPPLPFYMLTILLGIDRLVGVIFNRKPQAAESVNANAGKVIAVILVIFFPIFLVMQDWVLKPDHGLNRPAPEMAWYKLELLYRQAADSLAGEARNKDSPPLLAAGDVGVLGFYTPFRFLDTVGLNSPVSTSYYPLDASYYVINYAIPPDLILENLPDYIVILEVYGREGLLKDPRFQASYVLRDKIPTDIYGSDGMLIFQRQ
jgi:hypothetical protein